ncbi:hypothetical protein D3C86_1925230 [compost metagenome]
MALRCALNNAISATSGARAFFSEFNPYIDVIGMYRNAKAEKKKSPLKFFFPLGTKETAAIRKAYEPRY